MGGRGTVKAPLVVEIPGDKSISHRALLFAALARGESVLSHVLAGHDLHSTAGALRALGCALPELPGNGAEIRIRGMGLRALQPPAAPLDCGNSGTTARLLLGVLAAHPFRSTLTGDASLRSRPMRRVTEPLTRAGARFIELDAADRLPIEIVGGDLAAIAYESPHASAQVKSALLLAALNAGVAARITEPRASRDHTERMLRALDVPVDTHRHHDGRVTVTLERARQPGALRLRVPGDPSSAAFFLALGLLGRRAMRTEHVGLNPTRTGAFDVMRRMGGRIEVEPTGESAGEPVGTMTAWPSALHATTIAPEEIPALIDEIPILAILASRADGETRIEGAGELRVKESDRLSALARNLCAIGVDAVELDDGLLVRGPTREVRGSVRSCGDHRIAMAFSVLGALAGSALDIDDRAIAGVSFPRFHEWLERAVVDA